MSETIMYKIVTQQRTTRDNTKWEIGVTNRAEGAGKEVCSNQVLHCYSHPILAVIFNPLHAAISKPILLQIACSSIINSDGLKHACKEQTPIREVTLPEITPTQLAAFAIKCALEVYNNSEFNLWATNWLSGNDRSANAAASAYAAANANAANAADYAAAYAANAAAYAARSHCTYEDFNQFLITTINWVMDNIN